MIILGGFKGLSDYPAAFKKGSKIPSNLVYRCSHLE